MAETDHVVQSTGLHLKFTSVSTKINAENDEENISNQSSTFSEKCELPCVCKKGITATLAVKIKINPCEISTVSRNFQLFC